MTERQGRKPGIGGKSGYPFDFFGSIFLRNETVVPGMICIFRIRDSIIK